MVKTHPNRSLLVGIKKKVVPTAALTFFLCLTVPSFAITNSAIGTAYGTDYATMATAASPRNARLPAIRARRSAATRGFNGRFSFFGARRRDRISYPSRLRCKPLG